MVGLRRFWNGFKTFAILFSFTINLVLVIVLLLLLSVIFQLKSGIIQPLVNGLHSSFVGLDEATINTNITVKDTIPVVLSIPLKTDTIVTLTSEVPVRVGGAGFTLSDGTTLRGSVSLNLPRGLQLPVHLELTVPVNSPLPIELHVPVHIPLNQTELHTPFDKLRSLFDPLVRLIGNLPDDWGSVWPMIGQIIGGHGPNLLASNKYIEHPWPDQTGQTGSPAATQAVIPASSEGIQNPSDASAIPGGDQTHLTPSAVGTDQATPTLSFGTPDFTPGASPTGQSGATGATTNVTPTHVTDLGIITPTATH